MSNGTSRASCGRIPPGVRAAIIADVRAGDSRREIGDRYQVSKASVSNIAIAAGLKTREGYGRNLLTADQAVEIGSRYAAGEKTSSLAAEFCVSKSLIWEALRRSGVPARDRSEARRKYPLRHDALDALTPDAAYWCGFLFTDGTIVQPRTGNPQVALVLQKQDRGHLVKFRDFLGSQHAITPIAPARVSAQYAAPRGGSGTGAFRYAVNSRPLAERLRALGRYGPAVDPELAASRDFWRGCIDGDGTLGISCGVPGLKLVGSQWLLQAFVDFLGPVSSRRPLHVRPARTIFVVSVSYATAIKVVERLYSGAGAVLERKAIRAAQILALGAPPGTQLRFF